MDQLAMSLSGHDKGCIYAIVRETDGAVFLSDGSRKTIDRPKKKNPKHIRRIKDLPADIRDLLEKVSHDSDLVHVLRKYQAQCKKDC